MTIMKTTMTKLLLLISLLCAATGAHAATLTISGGDGNPDITRKGIYGVGLFATVNDPPTSNEEVEITGPSWQWSGGGSGMKLSEPTNEQRNGLDPIFPINYGDGGQKNVTVTCVATYTSKDKKTGAETPISVSGSKTVRFFVLVPERVEVVYDVAHSEYAPELGFNVVSPYDGTHFVWGSLDDWHLRVKDNRNAPYEDCGIEEQIIPSVAGTGNATWTTGTNGLAPGEFVDGNGILYTSDPGFSHSKIEFDVQQKFYALENSEKLPLNGQHHIVDWYGAPGPAGHLTSTHTD